MWERILAVRRYWDHSNLTSFCHTSFQSCGLARSLLELKLFHWSKRAEDSSFPKLLVDSLWTTSSIRLVVHSIFTILPLSRDVLWGYISLQFMQLGDETCTARARNRGSVKREAVGEMSY